MGSNSAPTISLNGGSVIALGTSLFGTDFVVQPNGSIIVTASGTTDFSLIRLSSQGVLDTTFGAGGFVSTDIASGNDSANSIALQSDGKFVVVGQASVGSTTSFAVARYNTDGSIDTSFGTAGHIVTTIGTEGSSARSVAVLPSGKLLVAGVCDNGSAHGQYQDFAAVRYNSDGSIDTTFESNGILDIDFSGRIDNAYSVAVDSNGGFCIAGGTSDVQTLSSNFALILRNSQGSYAITTDFGGNEAGTAMAIQADGKVVVAGLRAGVSNPFQYEVARYNTNGTLDTAFDGDGKLIIDVAAGFGAVKDLAIQADGKIVIVGAGGPSVTAFDFVVTRLNTNGSLDTSFDGDGIAVALVGGNHYDIANSVTVQSDGKILVAGFADAGHVNAVLVRFNADGTIDHGFSSNKSNTLDTMLPYTENGAAVVLDSHLAIYDRDLAATGNYGEASVTLSRHNGAVGDDVFGASGTLSALAEGGALIVGGTTIGTVTTNFGGELTLTFNGSATQALVNSALQKITYSNSSDAPPASVQIDWTFRDGNAGSQGTGGELTTTGSTKVTVIAVNDPHTGGITVRSATYCFAIRSEDRSWSKNQR